MKDKLCQKDQQNLRYNLKEWVKKGSFDILMTFAIFTLVQLMDTLGNANPDISIVGYWIFYSYYE